MTLHSIVAKIPGESEDHQKEFECRVTEVPMVFRQTKKIICVTVTVLQILERNFEV